MPTTITLDGLIHGFSRNAARGGEMVEVSTRDIVTTEDGGRFSMLLDQVSDAVLTRVAPRPPESQIDHLVIVYRRDMTAQVYINEVQMIAVVTAKHAVKAGDPVAQDSIADIHSLTLRDVDVPEDAGVLVLVSSRWRKGVFYDFDPIARPDTRRSSDELGRFLAALVSYLGYQDRVGLTESDRTAFAGAGWFPFIALPTHRVREMVNHIRAGWPIDDLLEGITSDVRTGLPRLRDHILNAPLFEGHRGVLLPALDHYEKRDYVSAATMLYPRIEGLLRAHHSRISGGAKATQSALAASAAADVRRVRHTYSLLLPEAFEAYLRDVYFAGFSPASPQGANRNTIGHGVAPETDLGSKAATIAVLIVEQLAFLCGTATTTHLAPA